MNISSLPHQSRKSNFGKLFSGVSAAALFLGVFGGTARASFTSVVTNSSAITIQTTASNTDLIAAGIGQTAAFPSGPATFAILNNGTIDVDVMATGDFTVDITAVGLNQYDVLGAPASTSDDVSFMATNSTDIDVNAQATGSGIDLVVYGINQIHWMATGATAGDVSLAASNSGTINISGVVSGPGASVSATGINQLDIIGPGSTVSGTISLSATNEGELNVLASTSMSNDNAMASGIDQHNSVTAATVSDVSNSILNNGTINVSAIGNGAIATGLEQGNIFDTSATGGNLSSSATNSNTFSLNVLAHATGSDPYAAAVGVNQFNLIRSASSVADIDLLVDNSGDLTVEATASGFSPHLSAQGIIQNAQAYSLGSAGDLTFVANNSGTLNITGIVNGNSGTAFVTGILQYDFVTSNAALGNIDFSIVNSGNVVALLQVAASGTSNQNATALAFGGVQVARATTSGSIDLGFVNETGALFRAEASAIASGDSSPAAVSASASAVGLRQRNASDNQPNAAYTFSNSGTLAAVAKASATGGMTSNTASAHAVGYSVLAGAANQTATLDVENSGTFNVKATANATNAAASATGMRFSAAVLTGSVTNAGDINVTASAPSGSAHAVGVQFNGDVNTVTFTNTGDITVMAIGSTTATGIGFGPSTAFANTVVPGTADLATIINDGGTISAMIDSGGTLDYGNAINALGAPNPVMIDLQGGGAVIGNVLVDNDDTIFVNNGSTYFEGMINGTAALSGAFTVGSTGTFTLGVGSNSAAAMVYVNTYTQTSTGSLVVVIDPANGAYGQVNATVANLDGNLQVGIIPALLGDTTTYTDVVAAGSLNGTFANSTILNNTAFINLTPVYDGDGTVDILLTRNAFNSLGGLTQNQMAVADVLESTYSTALTGDYGMLVQDLLFMDATSYQNGIEQLHGAEYAQSYRGFLSSFRGLNAAISDRVNVGPYWTRSGSDVIRRGDMAFWARADKGWGTNDGDVEAPGFDRDSQSYYAGFDLAPNATTVFGFAAGLYKDELTFSNGNLSQDDGVQVALYGYHDVGRLYLRGIVGYGFYNGETLRAISVGSTAGIARGDYDINVFSFQGELGHRIELSERTHITPYVTVGYQDAKTDAFTETGVDGANLSFASNSYSAWSADIGARFSKAIDVGYSGLFVPEVAIAYQQNFGEGLIGLNTSFEGVANSNFRVIGSDVSSGSVIANLGLTYSSKGGFELRGEYTGRFNSQYQDHSIGLRMTILFDQ